MRVRTDDDLWRVDRTYLGPKGKPLPLQASYRQWMICVILVIVVLLWWRSMGPAMGGSEFLIAPTIAWFGAAWIESHLTYDRPAVAEVVRVIQDLVAPRPDLKEAEQVYRHQLDVPRWRAGAQPDPRWWVRLGHWFGNQWGRLKRALGRKSGQVYENGEWRDVR